LWDVWRAINHHLSRMPVYQPVTYRFCGMCGSPLLVSDASRGAAAVQRTAALPVPIAARTGGDAAAFEQPIPKLEAANGALAGERRVTSVIFADVKGSTELLERLGTEAWVEVMNNVFQVLETQIYRYSGQVGQFRGDGLVAFFGAKVANEDDPEHAVLAALAMQEALKPYAAELEKKENVHLEMRVGVSTGEVIVANVGDAQYSEDTAMGEALTVAARMEASAEPGTVLVSETTYRLVRSLFDWQPLGELNVKGISHPIKVYRPTAARQSSEPGVESQPLGIMQGLIGRKKEVSLLKKCIEELYAGRGGITLVTGVKGMGKSSLVNQVRQHFTRQNALRAAVLNIEQARVVKDEPQPSQSIRWLRGRCRSYGHLRPYSMWLDLMHEWIGTHPEDSARQVQEMIRAQMETQWGSDVERDYPNLASFLSSPSEESATERIRHLDAEGLKRQFFQTVHDWILDLAKHGPLVISFADVQWADTTSIELLKYCLPLSDSEPVLWLLVYRPERSSPIWDLQHQLETDYPHRITQVTIPPLTQQENEEFIDQLLGPDALFPETRKLVIKKCEGNPYFIRELIFSLIAQGALTQEGRIIPGNRSGRLPRWTCQTVCRAC
jgi:class 3 adenylate cyclase